MAGLLVFAACASFSASPEATADGGAPEGGAPEGGTPEGGTPEGGDGGTLPPADAGTSAYRAAVLADGPIAYWRMGTKSGVLIPNEVGGTNALILQGRFDLGRPGAIAGDDDTAIRFDGLTTGYARAVDPRPFDFASGAPFTIEWWAKHEPVDGGAAFQHMIAASEGTSPRSGNGYFVYFAGDTQVQAEFEVPDAGSTLTAQSPLGWRHYALVFDGMIVSLVVDGTVVASKAAMGKLAARTSAFVVGATSGRTSSDIGGYGFAGLIDEVAVYDKALSLPSIVAHHQSAN